MNCPIECERVRIPGPRGELPGELAYAAAEPSLAVLLVPPHPHMGGSMENNIIRHLAADLPSIGAATLRFDYAEIADVAASMAHFWQTGHAPEDPLMTEDAAAAQAWLASAARAPQVIIGYSFGAYVAMKLAARTHPQALLLISPTISQHDFAELRRFGGPTLVIYSDDDFATSGQQVEQWLKAMRPQPERHCIAGANHFFLNRELELSGICRPFIQSALAAREAMA